MSLKKTNWNQELGLRSSVSPFSTSQSYSAPFISGWTEMVPGKTRTCFDSPSVPAPPDAGPIMGGCSSGGAGLWDLTSPCAERSSLEGFFFNPCTLSFPRLFFIPSFPSHQVPCIYGYTGPVLTQQFLITGMPSTGLPLTHTAHWPLVSSPQWPSPACCRRKASLTW